MLPEKGEVSVLVYVVPSPQCFSPITPCGNILLFQDKVQRLSLPEVLTFLRKNKTLLFSHVLTESFAPLLFVALSGCIHRCLKVILSPWGSRTASQAFHHPDILSWSSSQQTCSMKGEEWKMPAECHFRSRLVAKPVLCDTALKQYLFLVPTDPSVCTTITEPWDPQESKEQSCEEKHFVLVGTAHSFLQSAYGASV